MTNLLDSLHEMLTYYKGLNSDIQGYQKGDYATNEIIQTLAGNYQVSMEYLADNQEAANAAYERLSASYEQMRADYEAACEAREDAGRAEIIMGLAAVVVGTAAIICTAGAATPVVVALGVTAGAGSVMYGVSNITEGGQEVYYGATGDLESASWNPIRDTVFCGNQSAYDAWGNLNMTIAGLCIPISGAVAQSAVQGGTVMAKTVAVTTAKELFKDKVSDFAVAGIVGAMDQQFDLNQTEQALWTIGLNVGLDKLGDSVSARFKNTASTSPISTDTVQNLKAVEYGSGIDVASGAAKVDVDVKPLDGGAAGIGKNADGNLKNTGFVSGMSASDAARYNAWVDSCINGTHNGYPGLSVDDIAKVEIADAHVAEAIAVSKVDADAYLNLKAVEYGSGIKNVAEAPKVEVDIKPLEGATVGSESGKTTKGYSDFADGMSPEDAARYIANNEKAFFNEFSERARAAGLNSAHIEEAFTAMRTGDYAKMASYFDTSSPVNGAVFWSGNKEGAAAYANSIGGTIMEQTPGGQVFDNWRGLQGMYPEWDTVTDLNQKPIWDALSSQYANGAEGMATYVHPSGYEGKVWLNIEKPILEEKDIIIQEVIIDAK